MNIDGLSMHFLAKELQAEVNGARISKIIQLNNSLFVFYLRLSKSVTNNKTELKLLIDVDKNNPAILLTDQNLQAPAVAPNFCMFLRKYLQNGQISNVDCPNFERYIIITIKAKNSYFDIVEYKLIIELMGRYSNLILVDNGIIKDCLFHVDSKINSQRELLPMHPYVAPPAQFGKKSLLDFNTPKELLTHLTDSIEITSNKKIKDLILEKILGISPLVSTSLCEQANLSPNTPISHFMSKSNEQDALINCLFNLKKYILCSNGSPHLYRKNDNWQNLLAIQLVACSDNNQKAYPSFSSALLAARSQSAYNSAFTQKQSNLLQNLNQQINKLSHKLSTYLADIADSLDFALDKIKGDLLLANIYNYHNLIDNKKGATEITISLPNYYETALPNDLLDELSEFGLDAEQQFAILELLSAPEIDVLIKTDISFAKNAKYYFKLYNKKKNRLLIVRELAKDCQQNLQFYAENRINILNANTILDLDAIKEDLLNFNQNNIAEISAEKTENIQTKNLPGKPASRRRILLARQREQANNQRRLKQNKQKQQNHQKSTNRLDFISYQSSDGYPILIGKNATQNDYLSLHYAKANDIWLHLQKAPGCHVLIVSPQDTNTNIPDKTILEAAKLCAWYSRSQEERHLLGTQTLASVNVDYCEASKLKKAAKAKAGLVYYNNYHTIKVEGQSPEQLNLKAYKSLEN